MASANVGPLPAAFIAMDGASASALEMVSGPYQDSEGVRPPGPTAGWSYGHYLPRFPASVDCGTVDPEIECAAVLGYN